MFFKMIKYVMKKRPFLIERKILHRVSSKWLQGQLMGTEMQYSKKWLH